MQNFEAFRATPTAPAEATAVLRPPLTETTTLRAEPSKRRRPWRTVLTVLAVCLLFGSGTAVGVFVSEGSSDSSSAAGLRPASIDEIAAIEGNESSDTADSASSLAGNQAADPSTVEPSTMVDPPTTVANSPNDNAANGSPSSSVMPIEQAPEPSEQAADEAANPQLTQSNPAEPVVAVAEALSPSVVRIEVFSDSDFSPNALFGLGSGIVWDARNGYIVTNEHVVEGVTEVSVTLSDGTQLEGEVLGGSCEHDVAVVRVDPQAAELVAAPFAPVSSVRVGQLAVAIGSPFNLTGTVTAGIVSAVRIEILQGDRGSGDPRCPAIPIEMIQTDAAINRGNSGGALADSQGRVIGMNSTILTPSGGSAGVGFAIPGDTIELIAERIIAGESLELGYLGITGQASDGPNVGVLIVDVVEGSPADEAGLVAGDVIINLGDEPMMDIAELSAAIKLLRPGEAVELTIRRDGDLYVATVVLGALG